MENFTKYTDEEIAEIVENMRESEENLEDYMANYYEELMFIGNASITNNTLLNATMFGLRVCLCYYLQEEDYRRVSAIKRQLDFCFNPKKSIVDVSIIEAIEICAN